MEKETMKSAGAIIFTIKDNQILYLLLKHIKTGTHWGFPKGRVEENETEKETVTREVTEETGLTSLNFVEGFKGEEKYSFERKKDGKMIDKTVTYFLLKTNVKDTKLSREHSDFSWGTFEETLEKLEQPEQKELLRIANDKIIKETKLI
jgi:8-oxo-dGTP pyrophosphatase MutT (NUDIX family)